MKILTEVSARHAHLSEKDYKKLFGNKKIEILRRISQPGQYSTKQIMKLKDFKIRLVGPLRKYSQIEISKTEAIKLGINPPIKLSGDIKRVKKIEIKGPKGNAKIPVIIAKRHLHLSEEEGKKLKLRNNQKINIKIKGKREIIFKKVIVRKGKNNKLAFHIDTDEGNAAGINKKTYGILWREK